MARKKTPEQMLKKYRKDIVDELRHWNDENENGCNDPAWPDGTNMNLVRNHIIYYKHKIMEICTGNNLDLPQEYYLPIPPKVNDCYMANLNQAERVERLRLYGNKLTTTKNCFDDRQMAIF